jgi:hypothetical protein
MEKDVLKAYDVYTTRDYSIFKRLVGNRDIPESRISKIVDSIQKIGWVHNPIIVNEKMEVIDGQGRLTALQRLKMPVEYIIAPGAGNKECIYMNMNMVNWKLPDFIKSYAEQGNENYQRLLSLMEKYAGGNLDIISTALYRVSKSKHRDIKEGILQLTEEQYRAAVPRLEYVEPLWKVLDEKKLPGSIVTLLQTMIYYYDYPEVDAERLAYSVEKYIYNSTPWVLNTDCEREVENAYNYGLKLEKKIFIAHLVKEERMRRQLELNKANQVRAFERTKKGIQGFITPEEKIGVEENEQIQGDIQA